jgi:hypothetical protein
MAVGDVDAAEAALPDELLSRFAFAGTAEDVYRQAEGIFEAGAERIEFGSPPRCRWGGPASGSWARRVLPHFR